jgi:hypothetical protein
MVACFVGGQMKCLLCCFTIKNCYLWEKLFFLYHGGEVHCLCGKGYVNCWIVWVWTTGFIKRKVEVC